MGVSPYGLIVVTIGSELTRNDLRHRGRFQNWNEMATNMPSSGAPFGSDAYAFGAVLAGELRVTFEVQRVILTLPTGRFVRGDEQFAIAGGHVDHAISCANGREKRPAFV